MNTTEQMNMKIYILTFRSNVSEQMKILNLQAGYRTKVIICTDKLFIVYATQHHDKEIATTLKVSSFTVTWYI